MTLEASHIVIEEFPGIFSNNLWKDSWRFSISTSWTITDFKLFGNEALKLANDQFIKCIQLAAPGTCEAISVYLLLLDFGLFFAK